MPGCRLPPRSPSPPNSSDCSSEGSGGAWPNGFPGATPKGDRTSGRGLPPLHLRGDRQVEEQVRNGTYEAPEEKARPPRRREKKPPDEPPETGRHPAAPRPGAVSGGRPPRSPGRSGSAPGASPPFGRNDEPPRPGPRHLGGQPYHSVEITSGRSGRRSRRGLHQKWPNRSRSLRARYLLRISNEYPLTRTARARTPAPAAASISSAGPPAGSAPRCRTAPAAATSAGTPRRR